MTPDGDRQVRVGLAATTTAVAAWGLTSVVIKGMAMDPISIAAWRFACYAGALSSWMLIRRTPISVRILRASLPGGVFLAADVMLFFTAVRTTTVVNATTIGALQPVVVAVFATRFLGERVTRREVIAAAVAIVGVVAIVVESSGTPRWNGAGDIAAVGALLAWSGYFVVTKRASVSLTPIEYTAGAGWWVAALCFPVGAVVGQDMSPPPPTEMLSLLLLLVLGGLLGHSLMTWGIARTPLWSSSTLTLLIPVVASIAAWAFLDEPLSAPQMVAMAVVVAALCLVVVSQSRPAPVLPPQASIEPAR